MESNNKGFSLVELLVSIAILAVIMIPVLDNIVLSSRMNKKSRETQNTTMLAGNLLETSKLEPELSSMAEKLLSEDQAVYSELFGNEAGHSIQVEEMEAKEDAYIKAGDSCIKKKEDDTTEFIENESRIYNFAVRNLTYNNKTYDALITYDASAYAGSDSAINRLEVPAINAIGTTDNAVILEGYQRDWAASFLGSEYKKWANSKGRNAIPMTNEQIKSHMERAITITVNKSADTGNYIVEAEVEYTLDQTLIPTTGTSSEESYRSYKSTLFHSEFTSLKNIYYFYTPDLTQKKDRITVKNSVESDFGVYVVEQEQKISDYVAKMNQYHLSLKLEETSGMEPHKIVFHSNLGQGKGAKPNIDSTLGGATLNWYADGSIAKDKEKARLYEVTVAIYNASQNQHFLENDVLTSITSTKGAE